MAKILLSEYTFPHNVMVARFFTRAGWLAQTRDITEGVKLAEMGYKIWNELGDQIWDRLFEYWFLAN